MWKDIYLRPLRRLYPYRWCLLISLVSALIVASVVPGAKGFMYQFAIGKPWQYGLLTAPYDFPVYKSTQELQREQDSIKQGLVPIFTLDPSVGELMLSELQDEYREQMQESVPVRYYNYLQARLTELYKRGIADDHRLSTLRAEGKLELRLRSGKELATRPVPITHFRTLKEGYSLIVDSLPAGLDRATLLSMRVERFLKHVNVVYDEELTESLLRESLQSLAPSSGVVQSGERIIDQGEIVTEPIFNVLQSYLKAYNERHTTSLLQQQLTRIGAFVVIALVMLIVGVYLLILVPSFDRRLKNYLLIQVTSLLFIIITALNASGDYFSSVYVIPFVMLPILWRIFFSSYTSLVAFVPVVLVSALFVAYPLPFIFIQLLAGLAALISLQRLYSRGQMIRAAFLVNAVYIISVLGLRLFVRGEVGDDFLESLWPFGINLVFLMFTYVLAFLIEQLFGYVSNISLVELGDINKPLLRELSEVAPGTFQHSLHVSILSAEAATRIGADSSLIRTGALYHDIGKIKNPAYFTENQGSNNPHALLTPEESARTIIRHVTDGIALAQKHNLPTQIIDFIRTHHGGGMAKYFYITEQNSRPDEVVDPAPYTYPGPDPMTKEQGILMLADAVEASSRSLKEYTEQSITEHVDRIIDGIVSSGHLRETPLTFRDIQSIKEVFVSKLRTMYHTRISYPDKR